MTAENATNDFDDELLSAYVDGELTAAERARVEERLRSDPAAAALVDELRSLSSEIQRLPLEPLGRDLRAGVLAEIDQARADLAKHGPATLPPMPIDRRAGMRRGLVWSALAIAATIVVVVMQPPAEKQAGSDVAKAKKAPAAVPQQRLDEPQVEVRRFDEGVAHIASDEQLAEGQLGSAELPPGLRAEMTASAPRAASSATLAAEEAEAPAAAAAGEPASAPAQSLALEPRSADPALGVGVDLDSVAPAADAPAALAGRMSAGAPIGGAMGGGGFGDAQEDAALLKSGALQADVKAAGATVTLQLADSEGAAWFRELLAKNDVKPVPGPQAGLGVVRREVSGPMGRTTVGQTFDAASKTSAADASGGEASGRSEPTDREAPGKAVTLATQAHSQFYSWEPLSDGELQLRQGGVDRQTVWVEAPREKIDQLLAACGAERTKVSTMQVSGFDDLGDTENRQVTDKSPVPVQVDGAKPTGEASPADALAKSSGGQPAEAATEEPRLRVLFVLRSPRVEAATPAAPGAVAPAITPATTGEAR